MRILCLFSIIGIIFLNSCSVDNTGTIIVQNRTGDEIDVDISRGMQSEASYSIENLSDGENDTTENVSSGYYTLSANRLNYSGYYSITKTIYLSSGQTAKVKFD